MDKRTILLGQVDSRSFSNGQKDHRSFDLGETRVVEIPPETESVVITPKTESQQILPSKNKYIKEVNVEAVTAGIDTNIQNYNIRTGVTILGVQGNLEPDKPDQIKSVEPTEEEQSVVADTGYELAEARVGAIPKTYVGSGVSRLGEMTYEVSNEDRTILADTYLTGNQVIKGVVLDSKEITPTEQEQVIQSEFDGLESVVVKAIPSQYLDTTNPNNIYAGEVEVVE